MSWGAHGDKGCIRNTTTQCSDRSDTATCRMNRRVPGGRNGKRVLIKRSATVLAESADAIDVWRRMDPFKDLSLHGGG
jgi:hypothetical protein